MSACCRQAAFLLRAGILALCLTAPALPGAAQEVRLSAPSANDDLRDRLQATSLLFRDPEEGTRRSGADILAAARADYGRLVGVLYEFGYFAPVIHIRLDGREATTISPFSAPSQVRDVEITVEPGAEFRLGRAEIGPLTSDTTLPEDFRRGEVATTPLLRATTRAALEGWQRQGHATADVAGQQITARHPEAILDTAITIAPGPVITFGNLIPEGQNRMRVERIVEIAGLPTGEIYSPDALDRAEERLRDTGVFSSAALQLRDPRAGDIADVTALVDEAPLRRLGFGAEISSDEGGRLSAYWIHRNLFGGAERLRLDAEVSGLGQGDGFNGGSGVDLLLRGQVERPATFTPDTALRLEAEAYLLDEPTFRIEGFGIEGDLDHRINERLSVRGGVGLAFSHIEDALGTRDVTLLTLPFGLTYENRDDPLDGRSGFYVDATLTPFLPFGGEGGARFTFDGRAYLGIGAEDRTRLAGRLQLGSITGGDILDIPPDFLFFSGGSGTVRGQEYQSLGAQQNGVASGGRGFLGLSGELRHDFRDSNFGLVGFVDAGAISAGAFGDGASDWHAGAGLGVRYDTTFGPIRVDLATPVTGDDAGQQLFLYIGIGQAF